MYYMSYIIQYIIVKYNNVHLNVRARAREKRDVTVELVVEVSTYLWESGLSRVVGLYRSMGFGW